jgi:hypothetical protein
VIDALDDTQLEQLAAIATRLLSTVHDEAKLPDQPGC